MSIHRREGRALRVGHRGAAALAPENTLAALQAGVEHGMDFVEFDVIAESGGGLVLAHSAHEIPRRRTSLDEALEYLAGTETRAHVDLKQPGTEERVLAALRAYDLVDRAFATSLHHHVVRALRSLEPRLPVGLSYPEDRHRVTRYPALRPAVVAALGVLRRRLPRVLGAWLERTDASAAVLHHLVVTPAVVERCHDLGVALWAWTVNDLETARRLEEWGADAIISDDPRLFADGAQ